MPVPHPQSVSWQWLERELVKRIKHAPTTPLTPKHFLDWLDKGPSRPVRSRKGGDTSPVRQSR